MAHDIDICLQRFVLRVVASDAVSLNDEQVRGLRDTGAARIRQTQAESRHESEARTPFVAIRYSPSGAELILVQANS